jgi:Trehalose utilisation
MFEDTMWMNRLLIILLMCMPAMPAVNVLMVADETPAMEVLAKQFKARIGVSAKIVKQDQVPSELSGYPAVLVYIHKDITEAAEKAFIAYANGGGKLILLHHSISSGKRKNQFWFPFLNISLPDKPYADGGYKYFDPADFDVVNLAPDHYITSHEVTYPTPGQFPVRDTEVYLNHVFTGPRTTLLGIRYTDRNTGKVYEQPSAGWYRPAEKGTVMYFMVGHNASDFDNPVYAQILANAVTFDRNQ